MVVKQGLLTTNLEPRTKNSLLCETLALPVYPELSAEQAQYVVDTIAAFHKAKPV